jgi:hypothetical protein
MQSACTTGPVLQLHMRPIGGDLESLIVVGGAGTALGALFVSHVSVGSAAEEAGLMPGDRLLSLNHKGLFRLGVGTFMHLISSLEHEVCLTVQRLVPTDWAALRDLSAGGLRDGFVREILLPVSPPSTFHTAGPLATICIHKLDGNLGFKIVGGDDTPYGGVFVTSVVPGGAADFLDGIKVCIIIFYTLCVLFFFFCLCAEVLIAVARVSHSGGG